MDKIKPYAKGVLGFVAPAAGILLYALLETSPGGSEILKEEWLLAIFTALATGGGVYALPNRDPKALHQEESVQPPQAGEVDLTLLLLVATFIGVVLILFGVKF